MHAFNFASNQTIYFELFILVRLQQTMGPPSLMPIFAGSASFHSSCMF